MNMITSLPRNCIQAISHPTRMTRWQKVAFTTFLGVATGGVAFGVAFKFDAGTILSTSISVVAALVVLATTTILISKRRKLSPEEEFLKLNAARERASGDYAASLSIPPLERDATDIKLLNEDKDHYMNLVRQQINQYRQLDEETISHYEHGFTPIPSRADLQKTLDGLTAS